MQNILCSKSLLKFSAILLGILALGYGFYSRIYISSSFINFGVDQVRDLKVYDGMQDGVMPGLGPIAPIRDNSFFLPPAYFYLMYPAHFLFPSFNTSLITTGLISFLSIPLFGFLVYLTLPTKNKLVRVFLGSLSALWWSVSPADIVNANFATNTGVIFFFLFLYLVSMKFLEKIEKLNTRTQFLYWFCFGVISTILINLHTTAMAIISINTLVFLYKYLKTSSNKKKFLNIAIFVLSSLILMTPYFKYEISNNFENTASMLSFASGASSSAEMTFIDRGFRIFENYFSMMSRGFFTLDKYWYFSIPLGLTSLVYFFLMKKDNVILKNLLQIFIFYSILIFFYSGHFNLRYQILIIIIPILTTIHAIAHLLKNKSKFKFVFLPILITLTLASVATSFKYSNNYIQRSIGKNRLINTNDIINISSILPSNSKLCIAGLELESGFDYILNNKLEKNITILQDCTNSDYIVYPLFEPVVLYDYSTTPNLLELSREDLVEIRKSNSYILYKKPTN